MGGFLLDILWHNHCICHHFRNMWRELCGVEINVAAFLWGWKQNCMGFRWECSIIWLLWCICSNKLVFNLLKDVCSDFTDTNCIVSSWLTYIVRYNGRRILSIALKAEIEWWWKQVFAGLGGDGMEVLQGRVGTVLKSVGMWWVGIGVISVPVQASNRWVCWVSLWQNAELMTDANVTISITSYLRVGRVSLSYAVSWCDSVNKRVDIASLSRVFREEGLVPYMPELPRPYDRIINYNQSVFNVRAIHTAPAGLESTSLVFCYGLGKHSII